MSNVKENAETARKKELELSKKLSIEILTSEFFTDASFEYPKISNERAEKLIYLISRNDLPGILDSDFFISYALYALTDGNTNDDDEIIKFITRSVKVSILFSDRDAHALNSDIDGIDFL